MLPKTERLKKEDFKNIRPKIFFRGVFFDTGLTPSPIIKTACIVSKKNVSLAVQRNSIKRKLFTILQKTKPNKTGHYFFYIKKGTEKATSTLLYEEIKKAFATLN